MNRTAKSLPLLAAAVLALSACAGSPEEEPRGLTRIASATAGTLTVELLTEGARLETGLNALCLRVTTATGEVVSDADVTFAPEMAMSGSMSHGAPVLGVPTPGPDGLYRVGVVFQMPTSAMGWWSAAVGVTRPSAAEVVAEFPSLTIFDSGRVRTFLHFDAETVTTTKYVSSLNFLSPPRVGLNPVVLTLHRKGTMDFPAVVDASMTMTPWMPSMGHGAPGSVNPVAIDAEGRYQGQLSFTMRGEWETTVAIARSGQTIGSPKFATDF